MVSRRIFNYKYPVAILFCAVFLFLAQNASAANRYVDPVSGNDANNGTSTALAWKSIEYALENGGLAQGDTLYLMAGTHNTFKSGTDNWINPSIGAGNGSGVVNITANPGSEGSVIVSLPASTSGAIGYFYMAWSGTFAWSNLTFLNSNGGTPVAADWFYMAAGKMTFTNCTLDNNGQTTKVFFHYKVASGAEVDVTRSTIQNVAGTLVFYNSVSGIFVLKSSVIKDSGGSSFFIRTSTGTTGGSIQMINNTFYNVGGGSGVFVMGSPLSTMSIVNNIFDLVLATDSIFNQNAAFEQWAHNNAGTGFVFTNNIIWNLASGTPGGAVNPGWNSLVFNSSGTWLVPVDKTNRLMDPGFNNAPTDLTIATTSHILGFGNNTQLPVGGDIAGTAWVGSDIGAYKMPSSTVFDFAGTLTSNGVAFLGDSIMACSGDYIGVAANCVYKKFKTLTDAAGRSLIVAESDVYDGSLPQYKTSINGGTIEIGPFLADVIANYIHPKVVFVGLGINNYYSGVYPTSETSGEVAAVAEETLDKLSDYGITPIWMGITAPSDANGGSTIAEAVNDAVEAYCVTKGYIYGSTLEQMITLHPSDWQTFYYDNNGAGGFASNQHPDADGHALMASLAQTLYNTAVPLASGRRALYSVIASIGANGSISPASVLLPSGSSQTYSIHPYSGYKIEDVQIDGASMGPITTYTFSNIQTTHFISATFSKVQSLTAVPVGPPPTPTATPLPTASPTQVLTQTLQYGSRGTQVKLLQDKLKQLGFFSPQIQPNGVFGLSTLKAVQAFQIKNKITRPGIYGYGIVGPLTRTALNLIK